MRIILLLLTFSLVSVVYGQQTINGKVLDAESNSPIPGATVILKDRKIATNTDFNGLFSLSGILPEDVLIFSSIGFKTIEIKVGDNTNFQISLQEQISSLDEVVVVGYGSQLKKEVTGAVSVISSETIENIKPTRIEQALQGQVAGVNITSQSGAPGAGLDIRIRGISTNGDNRPLILVDGNVIEELSVINPSDIASISVLKDASAGIYGTRAANGVILITTKTGRRDTPIKFSYNAYTGLQETTRMLPLLNATEFVLIANEAHAAGGEDLPFDYLGDINQGTNWQEELFQLAKITNQDFSLRGGGKKSTYSASFSSFSQDGIVGGIKSNFQRYTGKINYSVTPIKDLDLNASLLYSNTYRRTLPENSIGSLLYNAISMPSNLPVYDENGEFTRAVDQPIEVVNPLKQKFLAINRTQADRFSAVLGMKYSILPQLSLQANYQGNYTEVRGRYYGPISDYGVEGVFGDKVFDSQNAGYNEPLDIYRDYTVDLLFDYEDTFADKHNVKITLGNSIFRTFQDGYGSIGFNMPIITDINDADLADAQSTQQIFINRSNRISDSRILSYFTRLRYDYQGKYLLTAVLRRDGSSNFGPGNKFGYFPSASAGWVVSEESFLENSSVIDFLKLRGSFGILGNDRIGSFRFVSLMNGEGVYTLGGNQLVFGTAIGALSNPNIQWEEQETFNIGLDLRLLNNKVNMTFEYYNRTTRNLLLVVESSSLLGTAAPGSGNPFANAGTIENKGFEFEFGYQDTFFNDLDFGLNYNFSTLENNVLVVDNQIGYVLGGEFGIGNFEGPSRMEAGFPIGYYYGLKTNGIFQTLEEVDDHASQRALGADAVPGDFRYVDQDNNGIIDEKDRTYIGDPIPDITMGLNMSLDYKQFDFKAYAFASLGSDIVRNYERYGKLTNRPSYVLDRWHGPGTSNKTPRVTTAANPNTRFSDFYVEDGSFVRVQNIQLGYSLDNQFLDIESFRLYISANNPFTFTKYKGFDPTTSLGAPIGGGFDQGFYPNPRTFSLGVNIKF
ncbi:MAG: SusC/RagA family protein [Flavobacteriaceae bacterium]|nr:SusC/RagA family protein [Flavobacteriaceae bacterium]